MTTDPARPGAASTTRAQRPKSWRPGFTKAPKRWDPDRAASSPGYPQTPEAFEARRQQQAERMRRQNAEGKMGRQGIPDGWAGRRAEAEAARLQAAEEGRQDVAELRRQDRLMNDDPRALEALAFACAVVRDPTEPPSTKTTAARLVLAFTKAPPATQQHVTGSAGMAWLAELAARSAP